MHDLICYKKMPQWNNETIPNMFREKHNTQAGTWAKLTILQGKMVFSMLTEAGENLDTLNFSPTNQPPFIAPEVWHKITSTSDDIVCQLDFYCKKENYYNKKYGLTKTHSEVINAVDYVKPCKVLDLGCGVGRNALFLNLLGFDVTAYDQNAQSISKLNTVIESENLTHITTKIYDINEANITDQYGFITSTVVLMFLEKERIPFIIKNMQEHTIVGGYNLIVTAMSTDDFPCTQPFSFTFSTNELNDYYKNWQVIKYNEDIGELHRVDSDGNRVKLRFATLLAKKITDQ